MSLTESARKGIKDALDRYDRKTGHVAVTVRVPAARADEIREIAEQWRSEQTSTWSKP